MSSLSEAIKSLKEKREKLIAAKKEERQKRFACDTKQFYEDSLKLSNVNDGMVIVITPDAIIKDKAPRGLSHKNVAQGIIDDTFEKRIDLDNVSGDFGNVLPNEYNSIFIRMVSVLNGASMIYYPKNCTEFQITELNKFNEEIKDFNKGKKEAFKVAFDYNDKGDEIEYDLDNVIHEITNKTSYSR